MSKKLTKAQKRLIEAMRAGYSLWLWGDSGFGLAGLPQCGLYNPREQTVEILLKRGLLIWKPYRNDTQRECGMRELELT